MFLTRDIAYILKPVIGQFAYTTPLVGPEPALHVVSQSRAAQTLKNRGSYEFGQPSQILR